MNTKEIAQLLIELRCASMEVYSNPSESNYRSLINKYSIIFAGEKFNKINSLELCHHIVTSFGTSIESDKFHNLLLNACNELNMKYEPLSKMSDLLNPTPFCYYIDLW